MSNYKGNIPRLKSNEKLALTDQNNTRVRNSINVAENSIKF